jgi:CRP/FNR family cyclic AMP-dependent transcriptional regulator
MAIYEINNSTCTRDGTKEGIQLFFSPENLQRLESIMYTKAVKAGSYLFWEGERVDYLYFVRKGRVKITKGTDNGTKITLYTHHAGDLFGQMDPFQDSPNTFSAEVVEAAEFGVIQQKDLETLLWQHGDLAVEFMKWMGMMHRMTQSKFRDLMLFGKPGALCFLLIRLSNSYGVTEGNSIRINMKITNTEMAEMIGATRESVNRMLSDMRKEDKITIVNGSIVIQDLDYLRKVCQCESCPKEICRV